MLFIFEQMAHKLLLAICSKIKTRILPAFLVQKMFDIELNTQFCPKNVDRTRVLFLNKRPAKTYVPFVQK